MNDAPLVIGFIALVWAWSTASSAATFPSFPPTLEEQVRLAWSEGRGSQGAVSLWPLS